MIRLVLMVLVLTTVAARQAAIRFPVYVTAVVEDAKSGIDSQVLLERDVSAVWQQYLDAARPDSDGSVTFRIRKPGLYWLLATDRTKDGARRGACLLHVSGEGTTKFMPLPRSKQGHQWGGAASQVCGDGVIRMVPAKSILVKTN
jgi:hypothetical protein